MFSLRKNPLLLVALLQFVTAPVTSFSALGGYVHFSSSFRSALIETRRARKPFGKPAWVLSQSATASSESDFSDTSSMDGKAETNKEEKELSMPWTDFQDWALRDNLPRYVVSIPKSTSQHAELFCLWRTMTREVTELCGYPIDFLQDMHARQLKRENVETPISVVPSVLPLLDEFDFESSGGVSGKAYGITGVADGTKIETPTVANVHITVPKGYVRTEDGSVAYELGTPLCEFYSLDGTSGGAARLGENVEKTAASKLSKAATNLPTAGGSYEEDPDTMLVRLGVSTGILLGGALAVNMLSHHLTVNVFWV